MAAVLVDAGRVVPALERDGTGQLRARWWPLPAAADRPWFEAMLQADDLASQRQLAAALAAAVDRCVRQRLLHGARSGSSSSQRSFGLPEAWLTALASDDSLLASTTASAPTAEAETALLQGVASWVRQGVAASGELQLCLRCHEPPDARRRRWLVELLLRPAADPSLLVPLAAFWAGESPFAASAFEAVLGQLGLLTRLAPELAPLLEQQAPASLELDEAGLVQLVTQRSALLAEAGFALLLPSGLRPPASAARGPRRGAAPAWI
jgi:cytochrome c553